MIIVNDLVYGNVHEMKSFIYEYHSPLLIHQKNDYSLQNHKFTRTYDICPKLLSILIPDSLTLPPIPHFRGAAPLRFQNFPKAYDKHNSELCTLRENPKYTIFSNYFMQENI